MADKKSEAGSPNPASAQDRKSDKSGPAGGMLARTPVLVGMIMLIEAAILFAGFKLLGSGPVVVAGANLTIHDAYGDAGSAESGAATGADRRRIVEVPLLDFRAPNKRAGRTFIYDVSIYLVVRADFDERIKRSIKEREALIKDRVRTIIADMDPEKLGGGSEPGLETLRRQVKHQLEEIVGEGMIEEVLVPRCIPFRTDF